MDPPVVNLLLDGGVGIGLNLDHVSRHQWGVELVLISNQIYLLV